MWRSYAGAKIYLDANVVIYALEAKAPWSDASRSFLDAIDRGNVAAVTSEITIGEVIAKPIASENAKTLTNYLRFFDVGGPIELYPVTRMLLFASGHIQASTGLRLIDALHLATAQEARCDYMLTHDDRLGRSVSAPMNWLRFSDVIL